MIGSAKIGNKNRWIIVKRLVIYKEMKHIKPIQDNEWMGRKHKKEKEE